jgi:glutathione S-transferase
MKLYYAPGACSLAPHILLRETESAFELVHVDTTRHALDDGTDFHTVNRKGLVPVLELADGTRLTEGPVIAQYIADRSGRTDLMPEAGTLARYRVMEWQNFITSDLHKTYSVLFSPALSAQAKATFAEALQKKYALIDAQLAQSLYLSGPDFSAADAYLFAVTRWAPFVNLDLGRLTNLTAYMETIAVQASVREAMKAEGLTHARHAA